MTNQYAQTGETAKEGEKMSTAIAALNAVIDKTTGPQITVADARAALLYIEHHDLAITALRQVVANPKNSEALAHAARMLKHIDDYLAKPAKTLPARTAPKLDTADDLV